MIALMTIDALILASTLSYATTMRFVSLGRMRASAVSGAVMLMAGGASAVLAMQETGPIYWVLSGLSGVACWPASL